MWLNQSRTIGIAISAIEFFRFIAPTEVLPKPSLKVVFYGHEETLYGKDAVDLYELLISQNEPK